MEDQDILFNICIKLDDVSLRKLAERIPLWREVNALLKNNIFWYERTMHLAGWNLQERPSANWKKIYYALKNRREYYSHPHNLQIIERTRIYGLDDLDTLLALEEIYDLLDWSDRSVAATNLRAIRSPEVLDYLIKNRRLPYDDQIITSALESLAHIGVIQMIRPLLSLIQSREEIESQKRIILTSAAEEGHSDIVELMLEDEDISSDVTYLESVLIDSASNLGNESTIHLLLRYVNSRQILERAMSMAGQHGNSSALRVLMEVLEPDLNMKKRLFSVAYVNKSEDTLILLLEDDDRVADNLIYSSGWEEFLEYSIENSQDKLIGYLLKNYVGPVTKNNATLKLAAEQGPETFKIVLSDSRIDPNINLIAILKASRHAEARDSKFFKSIEESNILSITDSLPSENKLSRRGIGIDESVADLLIRDKRVDLEKMDRKALRIVAWSLQEHIRDRIYGFSLYRSDLPPILEKNDLYSMILRFIIFKRPTGLELLDWMIEQENESFQIAAGLVLENEMSRDEKLVPIISLLLYLLYPVLTLDEIIEELRIGGIDEGTISYSGGLIGAYIDKRDK